MLLNIPRWYQIEKWYAPYQPVKVATSNAGFTVNAGITVKAHRQRKHSRRNAHVRR